MNSCERSAPGAPCCAPRSLGTYAALLAGKGKCSELTDSDARDFRSRLERCANDFDQKKIEPIFLDDDHGKEEKLPTKLKECHMLNAVYDAFNSLLDNEYLVGGSNTAQYAKVGACEGQRARGARPLCVRSPGATMMPHVVRSRCHTGTKTRW